MAKAYLPISTSSVYEEAISSALLNLFSADEVIKFTDTSSLNLLPANTELYVYASLNKDDLTLVKSFIASIKIMSINFHFFIESKCKTSLIEEIKSLNLTSYSLLTLKNTISKESVLDALETIKQVDKPKEIPPLPDPYILKELENFKVLLNEKFERIINEISASKQASIDLLNVEIEAEKNDKTLRAYVNHNATNVINTLKIYVDRTQKGLQDFICNYNNYIYLLVFTSVLNIALTATLITLYLTYP